MSEHRPSFMIPDAVPGNPADLVVVQNINNPREVHHTDTTAETQAAKGEDFWRSAADPNHILDLKADYEARVKRAEDEGRLSVDQRRGVRRADPDAIKSEMIDRYLQTGADKDHPRKVPAGLKTNVANLMNMSNERLQELADKQAARRGAKPVVTTVEQAEPAQPEPVPTAPEQPAPQGDEFDRAADEVLRQKIARAQSIEDSAQRQAMLDGIREGIGDDRARALGMTIPEQPAQPEPRSDEPPVEPPQPPVQPPQPRDEVVHEASDASKEAHAKLEDLRDQLVLLAGQRRARVFNWFGRRNRNLLLRNDNLLHEARSEYDQGVQNYIQQVKAELQNAGTPAEEIEGLAWEVHFTEGEKLATQMGQAEEAANRSGRFAGARRFLKGLLGARNSEADIEQRAQDLGEFVRSQRISIANAEHAQTEAVVADNRRRASRSVGMAALGVAGLGAALLVGDQQLGHQAAQHGHAVVGAAPAHIDPGSFNSTPAAPAPEVNPWHVNPGEWTWDVLARDPNIGAANAEATLHHLTDAATAHGHNVAWHMNPNGTEYPSVDGITDPQQVLDKLSEFRNS